MPSADDLPRAQQAAAARLRAKNKAADMKLFHGPAETAAKDDRVGGGVEAKGRKLEPSE